MSSINGLEEITDKEIVVAMRDSIDCGDGGYLCDTGPEFVVLAGRALLRSSAVRSAILSALREDDSIREPGRIADLVMGALTPK